MKRQLILLLIALLVVPVTLAQHKVQQRRGNPQAAGQAQRNRDEQLQEQNLEEFLHSKCTQVIRELNLSSFDSAHFEPVYHELQKEKVQLFRKYGGVRKVRKALESGQHVADSTLMRVVNNSARLQVEDALLEQRYLNKFARILTPLQLFQLQQAEQKFRSDVAKRGKAMKK